MENMWKEYEATIIVSCCNVMKNRGYGKNKILWNIYVKGSRGLYLVTY